MPDPTGMPRHTAFLPLTPFRYTTERSEPPATPMHSLVRYTLMSVRKGLCTIRWSDSGSSRSSSMHQQLGPVSPSMYTMVAKFMRRS